MASTALSRRMKLEQGSRPWLEQTGATEAAEMAWEGRRPSEAWWEAAAITLGLKGAIRLALPTSLSLSR